MEDVTALGPEPDDIARRTVALHHADTAALVGLPGVRRPAAHRAVHAAGERKDGEQQMVLGDDEVMHHAGIGRLEAIESRYHARRVDRSEREQGAERPAG